MFEDKTIDNIQNELLSNISDDYEKSPGYLTYDLLKSFAIEEAEIYAALQTIIDKVDVDKLTGDELEKYVYQRKGISRKPANAAKAVLTVTGTGEISVGDLFETSTGIQFASIEQKVISGEETVTVQAVIAGASGNVPANTITQMPVTIQGITGVTNADVAYDGYDAESDDSLRERYYESLRQPPTSGNKYHYLTWAKEIVGVGNAIVYPLWNGDNTVKVVIIDENKQVANADLISRVQEYIDPYDANGNPSGNGSGVAPIGAYCTVETTTAKNINISVKVTKASENFTDETIIQNIKDKVTEYFKDIALSTIDNYVSYAKIGNLILNSEGVSDYSDLTVNGGTANIPLSLTASLTEIPVAQEVVLLE